MLLAPSWVGRSRFDVFGVRHGWMDGWVYTDWMHAYIVHERKWCVICGVRFPSRRRRSASSVRSVSLSVGMSCLSTTSTVAFLMMMVVLLGGVHVVVVVRWSGGGRGGVILFHVFWGVSLTRARVCVHNDGIKHKRRKKNDKEGVVVRPTR